MSDPLAQAMAALREALRREVAAEFEAAREAAWVEGWNAGQAEERALWQARLRAMLGDISDDTQPAGAGAPVSLPVPDPVAVAEVGRVERPAEVPPLPASAAPQDGAAQSDESLFASFSSEKEGASTSADPGDGARWPSNAFPWRTPARLAVLEAEYPAGMEMMEIRRRMEALPGLPLPQGNAMLWRWVTTRGLKRGVAKVEALPVAPACDAAPEATLEAAPEEAPVVLLPEGAIRETPQLKRARELLAMELHPNDIKLAVRLSASEFDVVRDEHKRRAHQIEAGAA
jgi:hypothetical protein